MRSRQQRGQVLSQQLGQLLQHDLGERLPGVLGAQPGGDEERHHPHPGRGVQHERRHQRRLPRPRRRLPPHIRAPAGLGAVRRQLPQLRLAADQLRRRDPLHLLAVRRPHRRPPRPHVDGAALACDHAAVFGMQVARTPEGRRAPGAGPPGLAARRDLGCRGRSAAGPARLVRVHRRASRPGRPAGRVADLDVAHLPAAAPPVSAWMSTSPATATAPCPTAAARPPAKPASRSRSHPRPAAAPCGPGPPAGLEPGLPRRFLNGPHPLHLARPGRLQRGRSRSRRSSATCSRPASPRPNHFATRDRNPVQASVPAACTTAVPPAAASAVNASASTPATPSSSSLATVSFRRIPGQFRGTVG